MYKKLIFIFSIAFMLLSVNKYNVEAATPKITKIEATYTGETLPVGAMYDKNNVTVKIYYKNGKSRTLKANEWKEDFKTIIWSGDNYYKATYGKLTTIFIVPGYNIQTPPPEDFF